MYEDADFDNTLELIDTTTEYALTGAMCAFVGSIIDIPCSWFVLALPKIGPFSRKQRAGFVMPRGIFITTKSALGPS